MDDFRVIRLDGGPGLFIKIAPAISPIFGNNPGYQVYQYDRETGAIRNYQTYYLTDLATGGKGGTSGAGNWALEYDFRQAYGLPGLDPASVDTLADRIGSDPDAQRQYVRYYAASAPPEITAETIGIYRCVMSSVTPAEFRICYRGHSDPFRPPPLATRRGVAAAPAPSR
jgi:hypothetical protein